MFFEMEVAFVLMRVVAAVSAAGAVIFAFKLYNETDRGWYWLTLFLSILLVSLSQWLVILIPRVHGLEVFGLIRDLADIAGIFLFAVSCYGIYKTMKDIRKRVE